MSPDVISIMNYLEYGKRAPSYSSYKGIINTASVVGYSEYTKRASSKVLSDDAKEVQEKQKSYFGYTSRFGAEKTFSSIGWLDTKEKNKQFKNRISSSFSKDGDVIWECVLSLKDFDTSTEMKLFNEENYAAVFAKVLPKWFERSGFKASNMDWWMDYHVNTDNPHIHLNFFEIKKTEKSERKKLPMQQINDFKALFWNEVFEKKRYLNSTGQTVKEGFRRKDLLKKETYQMFKENLKTCSDQEFVNSLKQLYAKLPLSGRLQYNSSQMIPYRNSIDNVVNQLLQMPVVNEKYTAFIESAKEFDKFRSESLHTEYGSIFKQEDKKLHVFLANTVLKEFKSVDEEFWEREIKDQEQNMSPVQNTELEKFFFPVANSLIQSQHGNLALVRIPRTGKYIELDLSNSTMISEKKQFRIVEVNKNQEFSLFTKEHGSRGEIKLAKDLLQNFDDGSPILQSYYQKLEDKKKRVMAWEQRIKNWGNYEHDWRQNSSHIQKASFSWMNEVENEIDQARNEYLYGKELNAL